MTTDVGVASPQTTAEPQSARGRARLARMLAAATELFLRDGYEQTSIDAILVRSGGSKSTLYAYFPTKEDLFRAVIDGVAVNNAQPELDLTRDTRSLLTEFAVDRLHVDLLAAPSRDPRLIIAERERFPDLAQIYYERGPQRSQRCSCDIPRGAEASRDLGRRRCGRGCRVLRRHAVPALVQATVAPRGSDAERRGAASSGPSTSSRASSQRSTASTH